MHPTERSDLIHHAVVAGSTLLGSQLRMRHIAQRAQTIVDGHDHDALGRQRFADELQRTAGALGKAAAMDPHQHGQLLAVHGRRPDVQRKTLRLVHDLLVGIELHLIETTLRQCDLRAIGRIFRRIPNAFPRLDGLGRAPAVLSHGRIGIRNAQKRPDGRIALTFFALQSTVFNLYDSLVLFKHFSSPLKVYRI